MYLWEQGSIGTDLVNCNSSKDAIVQAKLNWEIKLEPVICGSIVRRDYLGVVRADDNVFYDIVNKNYSLIQNIDAFKFFDPFIKDQSYKYSAAGSSPDGRVVWLLCKANKRTEIIQEPLDDINLYCLITKEQAKKHITIEPLIFRSKGVLSYILPRKGAVIKFDPAKSAKSIKAILEGFDTLFKRTAETFRIFASVKFEDEEEIKKLLFEIFYPRKNYADDEHRRSARFLFNKILDLLQNGQAVTERSKGTFWGFYNAIIEYIDYYRGKEDTRLIQAWFGAGASKKISAYNIIKEL